MSGRIKWGDRRFDFQLPPALYPEQIERLRGMPVRLEDRLRTIPAVILTRREGERWSIQENAGHLLDIEPLFMKRVEEYEAGAATLHAADMTNRKTYEARHNERPIAAILSAFRRERTRLVDRLGGWEPATFGRVAVHPRLKRLMNVTEMLFFQAEHDDFHLARISELARLFAKGPGA